MQSATRRLEAGVAVFITLAAIWLRWIAATSAGGLWRDEANTVALATLPRISDVWHNLQYDSFPIVWLGVVRMFAAAAGPMNDSAFRVLGFTIGIALIAALWLNARVFGYRFPLITLAFLALSPSVIRWGDSMRAYGLGMVLILVATALIWRFIEQPSAPRFVVASAVAILSVHTIYYNAVLLLAICTGAFVVSVIRKKHGVGVQVVLIGLIAGLSLFPYVGVISRASEWNSLVRIEHFTIDWFWLKLFEALAPAGTWSFIAWILLCLSGLFAGIAAVLFPRAVGVDQRHREVAAFGVVTLIVGSLGSFFFLRILLYATQPWYYLTLMLIVALASEIVLLGALDCTKVRNGVAFAAALIGSVSMFVAQRGVSIRMTNADLAARRIQATASPRDLIVVDPWYLAVSLDRYYRGVAPLTTIPDIKFHKFHRYDLVIAKLRDADTTAATRPAFSAVERTLKEGGTIFLVAPFRANPPAHERPRSPARQAFLDHTYQSQWTNDLGNLIRQHASSINPVSVEAGGQVNRYETLSVTAARGWIPAATAPEPIRSTRAHDRH